MIEIALSEYTGNPPEGTTRIDIDGAAQLVRIYFEGDALPQPVVDLPTLKAQRLAKIYAIAASELDALTSKYSPVEVAGWREKEQQAIAFNLTNDIDDCPELVAEAIESEVSLASLVATVLENSATLRTANRAIIAKRNRLKAEIEAAGTMQAVGEIRW